MKHPSRIAVAILQLLGGTTLCIGGQCRCGDVTSMAVRAGVRLRLGQLIGTGVRPVQVLQLLALTGEEGRLPRLRPSAACLA